jgi:hypothetical protein
MNAADVLKYGHLTVMQTLDDFPAEAWETANVCGLWSTKQIIAHLASYEQLLVEVLQALLQGGPMPFLNSAMGDPQAFNDEQVGRRQSCTAAEIMAEYQESCAATFALIARIPADMARQPGALPAYGLEYCLDDFLVYTYYGHKREHCAQIMVFRDRVG